MENFKVDKKVKIFLLLMTFLPLIGLFGWLFLDFITDDRTNREVFLDSRMKIGCIGKIDSIYRQKMSHNILTLKTQSCVFQVEAHWEAKFQLGDSISKKKGELQVEHYRDGKLIELLDYRKYINKYYKKE